jgi:hypothetical protein
MDADLLQKLENGFKGETWIKDNDGHRERTTRS